MLFSALCMLDPVVCIEMLNYQLNMSGPGQFDNVTASVSL